MKTTTRTNGDQIFFWCILSKEYYVIDFLNSQHVLRIYSPLVLRNCLTLFFTGPFNWYDDEPLNWISIRVWVGSLRYASKSGFYVLMSRCCSESFLWMSIHWVLVFVYIESCATIFLNFVLIFLICVVLPCAKPCIIIISILYILNSVWKFWDPRIAKAALWTRCFLVDERFNELFVICLPAFRLMSIILVHFLSNSNSIFFLHVLDHVSDWSCHSN